MAVDLTTGSYDESGVFNKYNSPNSLVSTSSDENLQSLKNFKLMRIIKECSLSKTVTIEGRFPNDERPAIVVVEKTPFDTRDFTQLFTNETKLELKFRNNIYANYHVYPPNAFNGISVKVIHPAKEEDFLNLIEQPLSMIKETKDLYDSVVIPYLREAATKEENFCQKNEDRNIYTRMSKEFSFVFLHDKVEKCKCVNPHVRAKLIVKHPTMLSLRDLTPECVPYLLELQEKCTEILCIQHRLPPSRFECYIRYPPTTFPFHVYFETVERDEAIPTEQAHPLTTVISNLQLIPEYYQRTTLNYSLAENHGLLLKLKEHKNGGTMEVDE